MGDFNDRYDAITKFNFDFGDAKYEGELSCCQIVNNRKEYDGFYQGDDSAEHKKEIKTRTENPH